MLKIRSSKFFYTWIYVVIFSLGAKMVTFINTFTEDKTKNMEIIIPTFVMSVIPKIIQKYKQLPNFLTI